MKKINVLLPSVGNLNSLFVLTSLLNWDLILVLLTPVFFITLIVSEETFLVIFSAPSVVFFLYLNFNLSKSGSRLRRQSGNAFSRRSAILILKPHGPLRRHFENYLKYTNNIFNLKLMLTFNLKIFAKRNGLLCLVYSGECWIYWLCWGTTTVFCLINFSSIGFIQRAELAE